MMFQLNDVNQYLTIRFDYGFFLVLVSFNGRGSRRVRFQKLLNRRP
jgi:hypothetical protein